MREGVAQLTDRLFKSSHFLFSLINDFTVFIDERLRGLQDNYELLFLIKANSPFQRIELFDNITGFLIISVQ